MAKDVDLTSQEWLDIVFDGKNKEFGAYKMREASTSRHTKAIIWVAIALAIVLVLLILSVNGVFSKPEEETIAVGTEVEMTTFEEEVIEEEEEEMSIRIALAGNPNSGKTTLFNALTGSSLLKKLQTLKPLPTFSL